MSQTRGRPADIADRQRVWEVRRFCQVRSLHPQSTCGEDSHGDAALSALLRCLLYEFDADLAAISLLDEHTQHFLSVYHKAGIHDATVRTTKWYGCEQITHRGGICEKTIALEQKPGAHQAFEILDLSADDSTKSLPVVDGTVADFRHYAGVPLNTPEGLNVGTVFVFRNQSPDGPLSPSKSRYLLETANQAMRQLLLTVEALENKRSLRCNLAVSSMLDSNILTPASDPTRIPGTPKSTKLFTSFAEHIYTKGVELLHHAFELDGVMIQELPFANAAANINRTPKDKVLATVCDAGIRKPGSIKDAVAEQLLEAFPHGAVFHVLEVNDNGKFVASVEDKSGAVTTMQLDICEQFPIAEQFVFMPLRDSFHDRDVAFVLGWASTFDRVYCSGTDLPPLASFGTAIMTQVRRLEAQVLSRNKSDFLGSMSHEMRSPLHGMLACIDLLMRDTQCSGQQLDLIESAEACGLQLRSNIDNILLYSNIGSPSPSSERPDKMHLPGFNDDFTHGKDDTTQGKSTMLALIEDTVGRDARKRKSTISAGPAGGLLWHDDSRKNASRMDRTVITVDANPQADFALARYSPLGIVINNLLGNCLKFTGPDACVRVSLAADDETVKLSFIDAGRGMSSDFVKHNLLVPFAQQNPLDTGTGLGLALVQNAVQALGGKTTIDTDESVGTEVSVSIPRSKIASDENTSTLSRSSSISARELPSKRARLFAPSKWDRSDDLRHQRCLESLTSSLARTLHCWLDMDFAIWDHEELPDFLFLLYSDFERLEAMLKEKPNSLRKIVLCPDAQAEATVQKVSTGNYMTIIGPVTSSKVFAAIVSGSGSLDIGTSTHTSLHRTPLTRSTTNDTDGGRPGHASRAVSFDAQSGSDVGTVDRSAARGIPDRTLVKQPEKYAEPHFLLVDDNSINLKVVKMYAKKCSKQPSFCAGGGQEAIDAFKATGLTSSDDRASTNRFDIILLDLSMPEVSGFDVAAAVRKIEHDHGLPRTYIAALTGLVSDKDRAAAFAAGVDEYVTKPATLKDVQGVVANWKAISEAPS